MNALQNKVAVITGGNSGIELATAKRFVEEGAHVFITARRQKELEEAAASIGKNVTAIPGDITQEADLDRIAERVKAEKGVVDVIVTSAGITEQGSIETLTLEHYDKVFNLNARASVFAVKKLLPLVTRGGSIVLVSSAIHMMGVPGHTAYAGTKAALRSFARTWAAEFKDRGIRVNMLSPGVTDTPMLADQAAGLGSYQAVVDFYLPHIPLGRLGRPEEIASAALFLASDQSSYVTGSELAVDGGIGQV